MKKVLVALTLTMGSMSSFAGLPEMMKVYNNPKIAPKVAICKGNSYCNGFVALSKQWTDIPNSYRYKGKFNIKADARRGITYDSQGRHRGLSNGFYFYNDKTRKFMERGDILVERDINLSATYERGTAVLLYIEDKNGWVRDNDF